MSNDKPEGRPAGEADSLSATGMFLRAFGESAKPESASPDPFQESAANREQPAAADRAAAAKAGPGEFTQLFQSLESKPMAAPPAPAGNEVQTRGAIAPGRPAVPNPPEQAGGAGEFTRIFVGGMNPPPAASSRASEEASRPAPPAAASGATPASASGARGFSAPGVSGSASGEGSFTQIFNSPPPRQGSAPAPAPVPAPVPRSSQAPSWDNDPIFRPKNATPAEPSPSVTSLIASLGTPGGAPAGGRQSEPVPYRPEPVATPSPVSPPRADADAGGVTRLIQRLAQSAPEPAPTPVAPPPVSSGPGEYTRIIARMDAPPAEPPAAAAPAAAAPPAPAFAFPAAPSLPAAPPMPHVAPSAGGPHAPKFAAPAPAAIPMPQAPKPPAIPVPALAPPKSKLEAMVPMLLVINTFLLLVLLVVVIFLVKSR
ncbi:hypothetical protein DYQ86_09895 [Acidobacteria bacterium AB60]|nr:hypothetical protein DYQ86_09895 [Acidobacteria bacterium AB60]